MALADQLLTAAEAPPKALPPAAPPASLNGEAKARASLDEARAEHDQTKKELNDLKNENAKLKAAVPPAKPKWRHILEWIVAIVIAVIVVTVIGGGILWALNPWTWFVPAATQPANTGTAPKDSKPVKQPVPLKAPSIEIK